MADIAILICSSNFRLSDFVSFCAANSLIFVHFSFFSSLRRRQPPNFFQFLANMQNTLQAVVIALVSIALLAVYVHPAAGQSAWYAVYQHNGRGNVRN